jgi:hypothetical protein
LRSEEEEPKKSWSDFKGKFRIGMIVECEGRRLVGIEGSSLDD